MNLMELTQLARQYYISDTGLSETNLIRKIQLAAGVTDCFATGRTSCDDVNCRWRKDCLPDVYLKERAA